MKQANGRRLISHSTSTTTVFEMFDEKEMFLMMMELEPRGDLLDKVVEEDDREAFIVHGAEEMK